MTWTKLSDDFGDDCDTLSDAAFRLHVEALVYSNRKLLDCRIPKNRLHRFATNPEAVPELLAVGWWSDDGDVWLIRHHAGYQRTRDEVLRQQEANRQNGRRGGRPRKPPREQALPSETQSVNDSLNDSLTYSLSESKTERDGTGRDRAVEGRAPTDFGLGNCRECGHREPLDVNGCCSIECSASQATSARAAS